MAIVPGVKATLSKGATHVLDALGTRPSNGVVDRIELHRIEKSRRGQRAWDLAVAEARPVHESLGARVSTDRKLPPFGKSRGAGCFV
jgi:hypothetical protein